MYFGTRETRGDQLKGLYEKLGEKRILFLDGPIVQAHSSPEYYTRQDIFNAPVIADTIMAFNMISLDPIWLIINSPGGDVNQGMALYDAIKTSEAPVYTVGRQCLSMGAFLLLAGEPGHRYVFKNSWSMVHFPQITHNEGGNVKKMDKVTKDLRDLTDALINVLLENGIAKTKKQIEKDLLEEAYFNSSKTIAYGLADKIVDKEVMKMMLGDQIISV